jgi:hypothetical protein
VHYYQKKDLKNGCGLLIMPKEKKCWIFEPTVGVAKLEEEQQELLINSLEDLRDGIKSKDTQPITIQFIKN